MGWDTNVAYVKQPSFNTESFEKSQAINFRAVGHGYHISTNDNNSQVMSSKNEILVSFLLLKWSSQINQIMMSDIESNYVLKYLCSSSGDILGWPLNSLLCASLCLG